jgi:hypothetical protein
MGLMNSEGQHLGPLPKLTANVKNVVFLASPDNVECEIYVYKDNKIHSKLRRTYMELMELEQFVLLKYQKRLVKSGLMKVVAMPQLDKFNLQSISSMEAFKRGINNFLQSLISEQDENSHQFNYVCREALEFLNLNKRDDENIEEDFCFIKKDEEDKVYEEMQLALRP